jgi:hypothetical protein
VWDVRPEPASEFEIRCAVYNCTGVPAFDAEGTSDVFIKGFTDESKNLQETDTHYRNTNGKPAFNYRLLFKVESPSKEPHVLKLQAWDRDLFSSNECICEWSINVSSLVDDAKLTNGQIVLGKVYSDNSEQF